MDRKALQVDRNDRRHRPQTHAALRVAFPAALVTLELVDARELLGLQELLEALGDGGEGGAFGLLLALLVVVRALVILIGGGRARWGTVSAGDGEREVGECVLRRKEAAEEAEAR